MASLRPPALDLPDQSKIHWTSFSKIIRRPEENWPAQILEQPIIAKHFKERTIALIADPDAAKVVLGGSEEQFPRWRIYQVGSVSGRESLSASSGRQWRRQRRAFSPMFRPESAARLVPLYRHATARTIAAWHAKHESVRLDISLEMTRLLLGITWQVLFGQSLEADVPSTVARVAEEVHAAQLRGEYNLAALKIAELADAAERRGPQRGFVPDNPFDAWDATAGAPPSHGLTRQDLYDNARVFLGAGHETTALAVTWALWLIGQDAATQERVHHEIDRVIGVGPIEDAHIARLRFTAQVLNETLRLFSPGFVTVRQSRDPIVLAGERLPAASVIAVCIYALHRHRRWWDEPDVFRPDRFGSGEPRHRYAFVPFSAGRHACIGAASGWKEAITIFATILQRFRVTTDAAVQVKLCAGVTLRPDREVPLVLHPR